MELTEGMTTKPAAAGTRFRQEVEVEVVDTVDVLVVGGGAAGVTAALASARAGARTLLAERSGTLGGMMTTGNAGLTNYIVHQKRQAVQREIVAQLATDPAAVQIVGGLPMEITRRLLDAGAAVGTESTAASYVFTSPARFKWLLLDLMQEAGVRLMLHSVAVDAICADGAACGAVFENKEGRQAVLARNVVDATGDGDIAAWAGCAFSYGITAGDATGKANPGSIGTANAMGVMYRVGNVDLARCVEYVTEHPEHFGTQGLALYGPADVRERFARGEMVTFIAKGKTTGLQVYNSPDPGVVTLCCPLYMGNGLCPAALTEGEFRMRDIIRTQLADIRLVPGFEEAFLLDCPDVCVRESRHILGEYVLGVEDVLAGRDFDDSIGRGAHTVDAHGVPKEIRQRELPRNWCFHIPYRCLVPRDVENLLVAGRCASYTHEGFGCARPTVQCMVTGEAAGVAAAMACARGVTPRELDVAALRETLTAQGVLL